METQETNTSGRARTGRKLRLLLLIFLGVFLVYLLSPVIQSSDSRLVIYVSSSILHEGNTNLDEYVPALQGYYALIYVNGHYYSKYPIGTSLIVLPFVFIADVLSNGALNTSLHQSQIVGTAVALELAIASGIVALAAVIIFLVGRLYLPTRLALFVTFAFAFCTSAWSTSSRALWQHGPSMLMLTIALYLLIRAQQRESLAQYAALPIAFSYVIRPTNAVSVIILSIYVLLAHRRIFIRFLLWAACIALPFVLYSYSAFHLLLPPYYLSQETSITTLGEALLGHLFSPGRGLIIYSPIMLVAIAGIILKVRTKNLTSLEFALVIILLLHWLMISLFKDWPGGASFGARYFADVVPYFVYFLIPIVLWLKDYRVQSARLLIIGLTLVSLWINWRGAIRQETFFSYDHIESIWHDWSFLK